MHNQVEITYHTKNTAPNSDTMATHRKRLLKDDALGCHDSLFFVGDIWPWKTWLPMTNNGWLVPQGSGHSTGSDRQRTVPGKGFFDYLWMRGGIPGLLLVTRDRSHLTHSHFVTRVGTALMALGYTNSGQFSWHSFQVGAATTVAAMKVEESIIKTLGRRKSAAYLLYVLIPRE